MIDPTHNKVTLAKLIRLERFRWLILIFFCLIAIIIHYFFLIQSNIDWLHAFLFFLTLFLFGYVFKHISGLFKQKGKQFILNEIISLQYPESSYFPKSQISLDQLKLSNFFPEDILGMEGEDLILFKNDLFTFDMCELRVWQDEVIKGGVDQLFSGVVLTCCIHPAINGELLIWPKSRIRSMARSSRSFFRRGAIPLHSIQSDQHEYFASSSHITKQFPVEKIDQFLSEQFSNEQPIYMSVNNNVLFLALEHDEDLYEISLFRPIRPESLSKMVNDLKKQIALVSMIHQLLMETT